jgi:uncharacterized protein YcbX
VCAHPRYGPRMHVLELWRYPIKSIGGERIESAEVTDSGILGDRGWGLVDEETGNVLTGRREPRLLMATCRMGDGGLPVTTTPEGDELRTSDDYSNWLARPVRLEAAGVEGGTYENPLDAINDENWISWQGPGGAWHDSGQARVSLVSKVSLRSWDFRRFRANVLVSGEGEDDLIGRSIEVGSARLLVVKGIDRCVMVTRPQPGLPRDVEVLKAITRQERATLSVGATVERGGVLQVGDEVRAAG